MTIFLSMTISELRDLLDNAITQFDVDEAAPVVLSNETGVKLAAARNFTIEVSERPSGKKDEAEFYHRIILGASPR